MKYEKELRILEVIDKNCWSYRESDFHKKYTNVHN